MISKCSTKIVTQLIRSGAIAEEDAELYTYGFFVFLSHLFSLCIAVVWGVLLGTLFESSLMYFMFAVLRGYAGGFHSTSECRCTIYTVTALFLSSLAIKLLYNTAKPIVAIVSLSVGVLVVLLLSPLDTPAKPLGDEERRYYKKISRIILAVICFLGLGSAAFQQYSILYASSICVVLESILLLLEKVRRNSSI